MTCWPVLLTIALLLASCPCSAAGGGDPALSAADAATLDAVVDFDLWRPDPGLAVLLRRAGQLAELTLEDWPALDRPDYRNLVRHPARYRGQAIRMTVLPAYLKRLAPESLASQADTQPVAGPVWRLDCFDADCPEPADQPVRLFLVADPSESLGVAGPLDLSQEVACAIGRPVEIAALFYKVYTDTSRGGLTSESTQRDYPVLVAWNVAPAGGRLVAAQPPLTSWLVLAAVLILAAAYVALRVYTRARSVRPAVRRTRPHSGGPVDADLQAAAEQYRSTEEQHETTDNNS